MSFASLFVQFSSEKICLQPWHSQQVCDIPDSVQVASFLSIFSAYPILSRVSVNVMESSRPVSSLRAVTDALNGAWQESASRNVKLSALFAILVPETPQVFHLNDTSNRTVRGLVSDVSHSEESTFLMEMDVTSPVCPSVPQK